MSKILHWVIMVGSPAWMFTHRKLAREKIKNLRAIKFTRYDEHLYIGKVIPDPKRRGHGKIILEY